MLSSDDVVAVVVPRSYERRVKYPAVRFSPLVLLCVAQPLACSPQTISPDPNPDPFAAILDREPGNRTPLTTACDGADPLRCLLPWPSSRFTTADDSTVTGLRVVVAADDMVRPDNVSWFELADGFSTLNGIATAFPGGLAASTPGDGVLQLLRAADGESVPLRVEVFEESEDVGEGGVESLLVGYPQRPLEPDTDYVALVSLDLTNAAGESFARDRVAGISLGLVEPETQEEARLRAYHAPTRMTLAAAERDLETLLRVWDFTTRSHEDATRFVVEAKEQARATVEAGNATVEIDLVEPPGDPNVAVIVEGRLTGLPDFRDEDGYLRLTESGLPAPEGVWEAPFRVLVPTGTGDYRVVLFGHGTGGSFRDRAFDAELALAGLAKVGTTMYGWDGTQVIVTLTEFDSILKGTMKSTAGLVQGLADLYAVRLALETVIGDALSAVELAGSPNPAVGRRPIVDAPIWAGGSLGGTMGFTYANCDPSIAYAVVNVPGTAWTHWVRQSHLYEPLSVMIQHYYPNAVDEVHVMLMSQLLWDSVEGAVWVDARRDSPVVFLIQESMGDPVMPNDATAMVAASVDAVQVGVVLDPILDLRVASTAVAESGITQFRVDSEEIYAVHGFAERDDPPGIAAREQILDFVMTALAEEPLITVPAGCTTGTADGSCDFTP